MNNQGFKILAGLLIAIFVLQIWRTKRPNVSTVGDVSSNVKVGSSLDEFSDVLDSLGTLAGWKNQQNPTDALAGWSLYQPGGPGGTNLIPLNLISGGSQIAIGDNRSEERRVGKECRL